MKKSVHGGWIVGPFEIFVLMSPPWSIKKIMIGSTPLYRVGPLRIFDRRNDD